MAGETFGWGPTGSGALAFVDRPGHLYLLDERRVVAGVKGAWMPAWSNDGARIAFLQKSGRRTYRLTTVAVTRR